MGSLEDPPDVLGGEDLPGGVVPGGGEFAAGGDADVAAGVSAGTGGLAGAGGVPVLPSKGGPTFLVWRGLPTCTQSSYNSRLSSLAKAWCKVPACQNAESVS